MSPSRKTSLVFTSGIFGVPQVCRITSLAAWKVEAFLVASVFPLQILTFRIIYPRSIPDSFLDY